MQAFVGYCEKMWGCLAQASPLLDFKRQLPTQVLRPLLGTIQRIDRMFGVLESCCEYNTLSRQRFWARKSEQLGRPVGCIAPACSVHSLSTERRLPTHAPPNPALLLQTRATSTCPSWPPRCLPTCARWRPRRPALAAPACPPATW